jgi:hypothetical protein
MASAEDIVFMVVLLFVFVLSAFMIWYAYDTFLDHAHNVTMFNETPEVIDTMDFAQTKIANKFDYVVFVLLIAFLIAIIIGSMFVFTHPVFAIIYFLVMVIAVMLSSIFGYVWHKVSTQAVFAETLTQFPLSNFLLNNYTLFIVGAGFIGMIIMYAKGQNA